MSYQKPVQFGALLLFLLLAISGCEKLDTPKKAEAAPSAPPKAMPLPVVDIVTAVPEGITRTTNLPARLQASRSATIIPRISGVVERRVFTEGATVKAGDLLYQIDPGTFNTALSNAKANLSTAQASVKTAEAGLQQNQAALEQAEANRDYARKQLSRSEQLIKTNVIARQDYDQTVSTFQVQQSNVNAAQAGIAASKAGLNSAKATIEAALAGIETANINLSYTKIKSPINGIAGVSNVTEGAYVVGSQTQMAEVQQLDPLYVNITQPASAILKLRQAQRERISSTGSDKNIQILLDDGTVYPHKGRLLFVNQTVNESTGEVTVRAEVPNPDQDLIPGLYVRVNVPQERIEDAYLIPQQAVTRGDTDIVMIVEDDGSFRPQPVTVSGQRNQNWIITKGLTPNAKVIVDGMGQLAIMRGAKKVQTRPWTSVTQSAGK
ncbi:efflux RND transporter periplasmic adaptor subunit [Leucothrix arctica]|uniref:Efflux transporter periplasmic adaptor subunit n=1 Tax=Leucothrix arctica TaxID=1481894 RepID=A0A317CJ89_9GAMM|nr:efflux RND transporter periplasmic adaptor subunit [Leucothrix arctica]PWQ98399.1 efflux transporter periplasmic adaptor subunit [Leucothrix arctica]